MAEQDIKKEPAQEPENNPETPETEAAEPQKEEKKGRKVSRKELEEVQAELEKTQKELAALKDSTCAPGRNMTTSASAPSVKKPLSTATALPQPSRECFR